MHSKQKNKLQSPLGRARGLGSAHHGTEHKIVHNITTLTNIPLVAWVMYSVFSLRGASYEEFTAWMAHPVSIIMAVLFVISTLKHFALELQVVYEDYILCRCLLMMKIIGMKILFFVLGTATIISILKLAFSTSV